VSSDIDKRNVTFKEMLDRSTNEYYLRWGRTLEQQKGFSPVTQEELEKNPNARFLGSPDRIYTRYRFRYLNNISFGITAEKDAGEEFFRGTQKQGFDFYSAHFYLRDYGKLKALAVGDYHIEFGQGLTMWSGLAFGKSSEIISVKRNAFGIRPYSSVDENRFMRGAAVTGAFGKWEATAFYSNKFRDANVVAASTADSNQVQDEVIISSFQQTGLHRTPREVQNKNSIGEQYIGGHVAYKTKRLNIGATSYYSEFSGIFNRNLSYYNQFEFTGKSNAVMGVDYNYILRNYNFFGEVSRSQNGGMAQVHGALVAIDPKLSASFVYRDVQRNFQNLMYNVFSEASNSLNERGLFSGFELRPSQAWRLVGYYDLFTFPWMRYLVDKPVTHGSDYLIQLNWKPKRNMEMYGRIRRKTKDANIRDEFDEIDFVVATVRTNYRYNINVKVNDQLSLRSRAEMVTWDGRDRQRYKGFLMYQDIVYKPLGRPFNFSFRYALFETDNYDTRIYAYENDVLYYYSILAHNNKGSRVYLTTRYTPKKGIDFWFRVGQFYYTNLATIGSGLNEIQGSRRTEVRAQVRFMF
jgi:hypothetical protein